MRDINSGGGGRQWRSSANIMDLNLGKRRSGDRGGGNGMSSSADHMASEVTRTAASAGGGGASQQSYELIKSTQVGTDIQGGTSAW